MENINLYTHSGTFNFCGITATNQEGMAYLYKKQIPYSAFFRGMPFNDAVDMCVSVAKEQIGREIEERIKMFPLIAVKDFSKFQE